MKSQKVETRALFDFLFKSASTYSVQQPEISRSKPEVVPQTKKETIVVSQNFEKDLTNNPIVDKEQVENERKTELLKIVEQESKGMKMIV